VQIVDRFLEIGETVCNVGDEDFVFSFIYSKSGE
jgi:oxalate decarboxylase/phosphoglucose isomerase-like protein (cupin superfamily)